MQKQEFVAKDAQQPQAEPQLLQQQVHKSSVCCCCLFRAFSCSSWYGFSLRCGGMFDEVLNKVLNERPAVCFFTNICCVALSILGSLIGQENCGTSTELRGSRLLLGRSCRFNMTSLMWFYGLRKRKGWYCRLLTKIVVSMLGSLIGQEYCRTVSDSDR